LFHEPALGGLHAGDPVPTIALRRSWHLWGCLLVPVDESLALGAVSSGLAESSHRLLPVP
jgi:hypothetical protein